MVIPLHDDNPTDRFPFVTVAIIAACIFIYFCGHPRSGPWSLGPGVSKDTAFTLEHAAIPCELQQGKPMTVAEANRQDCSAALERNSQRIFPDKNVWLAEILFM